MRSRRKSGEASSSREVPPKNRKKFTSRARPTHGTLDLAFYPSSATPEKDEESNLRLRDQKEFRVRETVARNSKYPKRECHFPTGCAGPSDAMWALRPARRWGPRRRGGSARRQRSNAVARPTGARRQPSSLLSGEPGGRAGGGSLVRIFVERGARVANSHKYLPKRTDARSSEARVVERLPRRRSVSLARAS